MEFDSDCEIIDYPQQGVTITSDRQASVQARLPDSMAAGMFIVIICILINLI